MTTLQQPCPTCHRQLELPTNAVGRLAKCPACEAVFTVTVSTSDSEAPVQSHPEPDSAAEKEPPAPPAGVTSPPNRPENLYRTETGVESQPVTPQPAWSRSSRDGNPFASPLESSPLDSSPLDDGMAAALPADPYAVHQQHDRAVASAGSLNVMAQPIDEILAATFAIFGERCGVLILAFILSLIATIVTILTPVFLIQVIADAGGGPFVGIAVVVALPIMIVCSGMIGVGLTRVAIAVARNACSPLSNLLPPMGIVVRFLIGAGVMTALALLAGILIGGIMGMASASGSNGLVTIATVIVFFVTAFVSMLGCWLLWSWLFIVADGKGTVFGSIQAAVAVTMHNKTTSLLLVIVSMVLSIIGTTLCYVGHLVTAPLTMLLFAVAYLLITGQQISDPRIGRPSYQHPPLGPRPG